MNKRKKEAMRDTTEGYQYCRRPFLGKAHHYRVSMMVGREFQGSSTKNCIG